MSHGYQAIETNGYDRKEMANIYMYVQHVKTNLNIWFRFISGHTKCNCTPHMTLKWHMYLSIKWASSFYMLLNSELI